MILINSEVKSSETKVSASLCNLRLSRLRREFQKFVTRHLIVRHNYKSSIEGLPELQYGANFGLS